MTGPPPARAAPPSLELRGGLVVTMDPERRVVSGSVCVEGTRIVAVGAAKDDFSPDTVIDVSGCLVLPGLVQAHTHLCQTLCRLSASGCMSNNFRQQAIVCDHLTACNPSIVANIRGTPWFKTLQTSGSSEKSCTWVLCIEPCFDSIPRTSHLMLLPRTKVLKTQWERFCASSANPGNFRNALRHRDHRGH